MALKSKFLECICRPWMLKKGKNNSAASPHPLLPRREADSKTHYLPNDQGGLLQRVNGGPAFFLLRRCCIFWRRTWSDQLLLFRLLPPQEDQPRALWASALCPGHRSTLLGERKHQSCAQEMLHAPSWGARARLCCICRICAPLSHLELLHKVEKIKLR